MGGGYNIDVSQIDESRKNGNKILFVGRDFNRKNGPLVVEAYKKARQFKNDLELYIAGPEKLSATETEIHFLGSLRYEDLVNYFNLCDVFCMPSKFEAYGLVFPEALTFGLPCIGRNAYEMPYFIEDGKTGYLLNNEDSDELADLILKLLQNDKIKQNVHNKRDYYINEYSWNTVASRIYNIMKEDTYGTD